MKSNDSLFFIGGKGGGASYRNRPDNLRSTDTFEAVLGVAGVRAKLAPGGLQNLYLDGVAMEDGTGTPAFKEFEAILFDGDPTILAPVTMKLGQSSGPVSINLTLANTYPSGTPGDWKTGAVTTPGAEFLDLRFVVQQLYAQTKSGINDQTASIEIQMRPSGATDWINPLTSVAAPTYNVDGIGLSDYTTLYGQASRWDTPTTWYDPAPGYLQITGKTTSAYVKELRIAVPSTGAYASKTWEVRCRLIEQDYVLSGTDNENEDRRTISWESLTAVNNEPLGGVEEWRQLSWIQIYGKATDQISGIPEINGVYDLATQLVPPTGVWDPVTRVYTGAAWDGTTYVNAWTRCPAWQIKGVIEDDLSGVSALAPGSTMNKWDVLEASKWFAELVPDGKGGEHPRYSADWFLEQPMQVNELVNYLGGAVGAFCYDSGDGKWRMKVEKPENPVMMFTKENIIGEFVYSHTDLDGRFNDYTGVFRNAENRYQEDRVRVFDQDNIDLTGRRHTSVALVGCTNRQEALRRLKIRLLSSLNETRMVTFTTNRLGSLLAPLSVITVADGDLNTDSALRSTGRIVWMNTARTEIKVRDTMRLELGVAYTLSLTIPNPDYLPDTTTQPTNPEWNKPTINITRSLTNTSGQRGDVTTLYLDSALPSSVPDFATVALSATGLPALPKQYRVVNAKPNDDGETWGVTAIEIYTAKWAESDAVTEEEINAQLVDRQVPAPLLPSAGMFNLLEYQSEFSTKRSLVVNWERPASMFVDDYKVEYRYNGGPWVSLGNTRDTFYEMSDPLEGDYTFRIYTRDRRGIVSLPLEQNTTIDEQLLLAPSYRLTNEAVTVAADAAGTVASFATAGGSFQFRTQKGLVTTGITYSVVSTSGGLSISIHSTTGAYTVSALTSDTGSATLRATYEGVDYDLIYSIAKARTGADGAIGANNTTVNIYKRATSTPTLPSVSTTYTFATGSLVTLNNGWTRSIPAGTDPLYISFAVASSVGGTATIAAGDWAAPEILVQNGSPGAPGDPATTAYLTNESVTLWAYADGTVTSYGPATGSFKVFAGSTDVSSNFSLSTQANPQSLSVTYASQTYTVTGGLDVGEDTATLTIRATGSGPYAGVTFDKVFTIAKTTGGYEIVGTLPSTNLFDGRMVYLTTDKKLYRYRTTPAGWSIEVDGADIKTGSITAAKMAVTQLDAISATIGTLRTATSGARLEISDNVIKVYDSAGNLRVRIGDLSL